MMAYINQLFRQGRIGQWKGTEMLANLTEDERSILDTYAYAVWTLLEELNVRCSSFHPDRQTTLSCGMCPACRIRQRQKQVENIARGEGYVVLTAATGPDRIPDGYGPAKAYFYDPTEKK